MRQHIGRPLVVAVQKQQPLPFCGRDAGVAGGGQALVFLVQRHHAGDLGGKGVAQGAAGVGGAVVHQDALPVRRAGLFRHALDAKRQIPLHIVHRHDDRKADVTVSLHRGLLSSGGGAARRCGKQVPAGAAKACGYCRVLRRRNCLPCELRRAAEPGAASAAGKRDDASIVPYGGRGDRRSRSVPAEAYRGLQGGRSCLARTLRKFAAEAACAQGPIQASARRREKAAHSPAATSRQPGR